LAAGAERILVQAPNHLGDVVMALPALARIAERHPGARIDGVARPHVAPLLAMAGLPFRSIVVGRSGGWRAAWRLRAERYDRAYLFAPSFRAAAFAWLAGVRTRRGTPTDARRFLLTEATAPVEAPGEHRIDFYLRIADPEWVGGEPPGPRLRVDEASRRALEALMDDRKEGPTIGVFPRRRSRGAGSS
jgi:heptosyltransferase-2